MANEPVLDMTAVNVNMMMFIIPIQTQKFILPNRLMNQGKLLVLMDMRIGSVGDEPHARAFLWASCWVT